MYSVRNIFSKIFHEETSNFTTSIGHIQNAAPHSFHLNNLMIVFLLNSNNNLFSGTISQTLASSSCSVKVT